MDRRCWGRRPCAAPLPDPCLGLTRPAPLRHDPRDCRLRERRSAQR